MTRARFVVFTTIVSSLMAVTALVHAQVPVAVATRTSRAVPITVGRLVSASPRGVDVLGIVQNHAGVLVPNAGTVLIRELETGTIAGRGEVNGLAQFSVRALPPGLYAAELVSSSGAVIASTASFSASAGQVVQISQTIPAPPLHAFSRTVRSATEAALSTAASTGITAIRSGAPVTPGS
jgi:hypothetical protein